VCVLSAIPIYYKTAKELSKPAFLPTNITVIIMSSTLIINVSSVPVQLPDSLGGASMGEGARTVVLFDYATTLATLIDAGLIDKLSLKTVQRTTEDEINLKRGVSSVHNMLIPNNAEYALGIGEHQYPLVERLVFQAILATDLALLIPAVQKVREGEFDSFLQHCSLLAQNMQFHFNSTDAHRFADTDSSSILDGYIGLGDPSVPTSFTYTDILSGCFDALVAHAVKQDSGGSDGVADLFPIPLSPITLINPLPYHYQQDTAVATYTLVSDLVTDPISGYYEIYRLFVVHINQAS
jgi:hypothetical protein